MGDIVKLPPVTPVIRCEGGCGPAVYEDDDGVPLCKACYDSLETETLTQRRAREIGMRVVDGGGNG